MPLPIKAASVAGAANGISFGASTFEKTSRHPAEPVPGHGFPETTYALNPPAMLSGENAAAVAPSSKNVETFCDELVLQLWQMKTRLGESEVSEKIATVPSGEVASTFPATLGISDGVEPVKTTAVSVPKLRLFTPRYVFAPDGLNRIEFGGKGKVTGAPERKSVAVPERVMGTARVVQL
jgi:hypothetical protein